MINFLTKWLLLSMVVILTAWLIPGISVSNFMAAMFVCIVIAIINLFIRPFIEFIALPINFVTLGVFSLVINAFLLLLTGKLSPGFEVNGFISALLGSLLLSFFASIINKNL